MEKEWSFSTTFINTFGPVFELSYLIYQCFIHTTVGNLGWTVTCHEKATSFSFRCTSYLLLFLGYMQYCKLKCAVKNGWSGEQTIRVTGSECVEGNGNLLCDLYGEFKEFLQLEIILETARFLFY